MQTRQRISLSARRACTTADIGRWKTAITPSWTSRWPALSKSTSCSEGRLDDQHQSAPQVYGAAQLFPVVIPREIKRIGHSVCRCQWARREERFRSTLRLLNKRRGEIRLSCSRRTPARSERLPQSHGVYLNSSNGRRLLMVNHKRAGLMHTFALRNFAHFSLPLFVSYRDLAQIDNSHLPRKVQGSKIGFQQNALIARCEFPLPCAPQRRL